MTAETEHADGRVLTDRVLVSDQAPTGLAPSGFDPSRYGSWICSELMSLAESGLVNHAMYDRWISITDKEPPLARNDCGWADLAAIAILCLRHCRDSDGSPEGRDAQRLDGEAATARAEGIASTEVDYAR